MKTVVGLYNSFAEANKVQSALHAAGYEAAHIKVIDLASEGYTNSTQGEDRGPTPSMTFLGA